MLPTRRSARTLLATILFWAMASGLEALAQDARLVLPSFDALAKQASETVDVTLDNHLLQLAGGFVGDDEVKGLLKDLKGIYVRSFEFGADSPFPAAEVDAIRRQLSQGRWNRIVSSRSGDRELSEVFVWMDQAAPGGMAILSTSPHALTIVNLVGRIDLERLRRLEGNFGIPKVPLEKR